MAAMCGFRWDAGNAERHRRYANELVALAPDVILATGNPTVAALQKATRTVPMTSGPQLTNSLLRRARPPVGGLSILRI